MEKTSKSKISCDAILFDLDCVLIDSTGCIIRHWKTWADQHGINLEKIMQIAYGLRTIETMRLVAPHLDLAKEEEQFTANEIIDTEGIVAIKGAHQILSALPEGAWSIVTSGSSKLVKARLKESGLPNPNILITADDVIQGKPAPEPYLMGAKRLGITPEQCVVVEDAPAGIEAGKNAGMRVIGVASTHTREELLEIGADFLIDELINLTIRTTGNGHHLAIELE
jgi:mannitol-1-/sugar-/sorbitol-6-phosphatase